MAVPSLLRDITIDELFSWRENFGYNSRTILGNHAYCSTETYEAIKGRCDRVEQTKLVAGVAIPLTDLQISVDESVPLGIIRPGKLLKASLTQ